MDAATLTLVLVIVTALAFDFTNGFHDTGNAMATSIATGALKPKVAVGLSAILNLVGAFLSVEVALTVTNSVINLQEQSGAPKAELLADGGQAVLLIILAGLVGGIVWNLFTWLYGLPSSSSHALLGGLVGSTMAGLGVSGVKWTGDGTKLDGVVGKILLPALISPTIAIAVAALGTWLVFRITNGVTERYRQKGFRWGQVGSASLVSLAHGTNDAQKTMGVMTLALIAAGTWTDTTAVPFWVKLTAASAIALGTWLGGWRIIRTLGKGLIDISPAQGMAAESSSAAVILSSSHLGFALSTTHVATGSILGSGVGRGAPVRWNVAARILAGFAITLPSAGLVAAVMWFIGDRIGGALGAFVVFLVLAALSTWMWLRARRAPIDAHNVNDEWTGTPGGSGGGPGGSTRGESGGSTAAKASGESTAAQDPGSAPVGGSGSGPTGGSGSAVGGPGSGAGGSGSTVAGSGGTVAGTGGTGGPAAGSAGTAVADNAPSPTEAPHRNPVV